MKKIFLLFALVLSTLFASAQQTYFTPGVMPLTKPFTPTYRVDTSSTTDSLKKITLANGNKSYLIYTAAQSNQRYALIGIGGYKLISDTSLQHGYVPQWQLRNYSAPISGSNNYIQNQNSNWQTANFNITGDGQFKGTDSSTMDMNAYGINVNSPNFFNSASLSTSLLQLSDGTDNWVAKLAVNDGPYLLLSNNAASGANSQLNYNNLQFTNGSGFTSTVGYSSIMANRNITLPDNSGTLALTSDLPTSLPPNGAAGGSLGGTYPNPTVVTNANLTGPITSSGNTTSVASQTGIGSTFAMNTSPTFVTPTLGVASATSLNITGGGGAGYINLPPSTGSSVTTPSTGVNIFGNNAPSFGIKGNTGFYGLINLSLLTSSHLYILPDVSGILAINPNTTTGDIVYQSTNSTTGTGLARLPIGSNGNFMQVVSGLPAWVSPDSAPTSSSVNPINSGSVYTALQLYQSLITSGPVSVTSGVSALGQHIALNGGTPQAWNSTWQTLDINSAYGNAILSGTISPQILLMWNGYFANSSTQLTHTNNGSTGFLLMNSNGVNYVFRGYGAAGTTNGTQTNVFGVDTVGNETLKGKLTAQTPIGLTTDSVVTKSGTSKTFGAVPISNFVTPSYTGFDTKYLNLSGSNANTNINIPQVLGGGFNLAATPPTLSTIAGGWAIGNNYTNGGGETDIFANIGSAGTVGGVNMYGITNSGTVTPLFMLNGTSNALTTFGVIVPGSVPAQGSITTKYLTLDPTTGLISSRPVTDFSAGSGTVTSVTSANSDILVVPNTTTPVLTLNSGSGANQIAKRDGSGNFNATTVTTNANLTGPVTSVGNATSLGKNIALNGGTSNPWLSTYNAVDIGASAGNAVYGGNSITISGLIRNGYKAGTIGQFTNVVAGNISAIQLSNIGFILYQTGYNGTPGTQVVGTAIFKVDTTGKGTFASSVMATAHVTTGGTTSQFVDGTGALQNISSVPGAVSSVSNSDGSLTISPTTGAVVGSLNTAHSNTFTAGQLFNGITAKGNTNIQFYDSANAFLSTFQSGNYTTSYTWTLPPATGTLALTSQLSIHGNSTTTGAATTAVTVTIGSTMANTNYYVDISPQDLLTAVNYYISAKTTTTFTVTFISALTGSINFDYSVTP